MIPTILVGWQPVKEGPFLPYGKWGCFAALAVQPSQPVVIKGAGFNPKEEVTIKVCFGEKDIPFVEKPLPIVNPCGAFDYAGKLPVSQLPPGVNHVPTSVKAWVGKELRAVCPINIVDKLPPLP